MTISEALNKEAINPWNSNEMMTIAASRSLKNGMICFVGIGIPSTAAILAKSMHAPEICLMYESGTFNTNPTSLPLSIGDGELASKALTVVGMPEVFNYWLQAGRIDMGFLGAAQVDKFANINTTIIGKDYQNPKVRLPGAGGAPEIAGACKEVVIIIKHNPRAFVEKVDFITSVGFGDGAGYRERHGLTGGGPTAVITDLGILKPSKESCELELVQLHPGVTVDMVKENTGWDIKISKDLTFTEVPTESELLKVRALVATLKKAPKD